MYINVLKGAKYPNKKEKKLRKKKYFLWILMATEEKSRIRIRNPVVRIRGVGSASQPKGGRAAKC